MIQPLRRYHRLIVAGMSITLPAIFAAGLAARRPVVAPAASLTNAPDTLIYWSPQRPAGGRVPDTAVLLDNAHSMRRPAGTKGYLITYSLAWQKIVATEEAP